VKIFFAGATGVLGGRVVPQLIEATLAGGTRRYIQESFAPIYPGCGNQLIDENTPPHPAKYNRAVLDAECATRRFTQQGCMGITLRFAYLYGAGSPTTVATTQYAERGWGLIFGAPYAYYSRYRTTMLPMPWWRRWTCLPKSIMSVMTSRSCGANTSIRWPVYWGYHRPGSHRVGS
jgi:nucleoside-diphosphate-sugar epimerase